MRGDEALALSDADDAEKLSYMAGAKSIRTEKQDPIFR